MRRLIVVVGLLLLASFGGCRMCQDCFDYTGPVLDSPNHPNNKLRSGSAFGGAPAGVEVPADAAYEEPYAPADATIEQ